MSRLKPKAPTEVVTLSYWVFAVWWSIILSVHVVTGIYTALYAYSYWELQRTYLNNYLVSFQIGMTPPYHSTIAIVHAAMSALHAVCIALMVGGSVWQRSLAFTPWASCDAVSVKSTKDNSNRTDSAVLLSFAKLYTKVSDRHGMCGVNGDHFHALLIAREVVETALQTVQAYRMSLLLPRALLNRFYVLLLVVNCWSSVLVYSVFFKGDEARRRFECIVLDCVLDLMSCMGVELIVLLSYASDYDVEGLAIPDFMWRDDEWAARALNEFRMVLVVSWSDLASRAIFSLGLVLTTTNMKELLQRNPRNLNRVAELILATGISNKQRTSSEKLGAVAPKLSRISSSALADSQLAKKKLFIKASDSNRGMNLRSKLLVRAAHLLFGGWGLVVLGLHIHASVQPTLPQCLMQVRPWTVSRPACYLVGLDCYTLDITGKKDEVAAKWSEFASSSVVQLLIRHCPTLEIPDSISEFHKLHGMKVYNSTIVDWGVSAALTNANHPEILSVYLARVNMTGGLLPVGLQSSDFPQYLVDVELCVTNLSSVPDDLDAKWHRKAVIQLEYSQLRTISPVLWRLEPKFLALTGNPITEVPQDVFEIPGLRTLGLGAMDLHQLPRNVTNLAPTLNMLFLDGTGISFFWSWADELVTLETWGILVATASPYCIDLKKIENGTADTFSILPSAEYSSFFMDTSGKNLQNILYNVYCDGEVDQYYFIHLDDANMAISTPSLLVRPQITQQ